MALIGKLMSEEETSAHMDKWLESLEKNIQNPGEKDDPEAMLEVYDVASFLINKFKSAECYQVRVVAFIAIQAIVRGPEYIESLDKLITNLDQGKVRLVFTVDLNLLMGDAAGRA